jgi:hypothetical protein
MTPKVQQETPWLPLLQERLTQFSRLKDDWDTYGAPAPNGVAVALAERVLTALADADSGPPSVDPSAEGGICLSLRSGDRYGDIECFNSGEVLAVTSKGGDETEVWEIPDIEQDLGAAVSRIQAFVGR